jgi:hypothetical protein
MGFFGNLGGQILGGLTGGLFNQRDTGAQIGGTLGNLLPFKKGTRINKKMMLMNQGVILPMKKRRRRRK